MKGIVTGKVKYLALGLLASSALAGNVWAHGDVTPQAIDTSGIPQLGEEWAETNPYRELDGDTREEVVRIGASATTKIVPAAMGLKVFLAE